MENIIKKFIDDKKLSIVGVSGKKGNWGQTLFKEFKKRGYNVKPVNPNFSELEGEKCFSDIDELPDDIHNIIITVSEQKASEILKASSFKNRENIWLIYGNSSKRNIGLAKEKNLGVIHSLCPFMFIYEKGFHRFHYKMWRFLHLFPKDYSIN